MEIVKVLKALGCKNRLRILRMLENKNLCVCEITEILGIRQPSVSRHLKILKEAGIIGERKNGFFTEYFLLKENLWFKVWEKLKDELEKDEIIRKDLEKVKSVSRYEIKKF